MTADIMTLKGHPRTLHRAALHNEYRAERIAGQTTHWGRPIGLSSGEVVNLLSRPQFQADTDRQVEVKVAELVARLRELTRAKDTHESMLNEFVHELETWTPWATVPTQQPPRSK